MPDSTELLDVARVLSNSDSPTGSSDAERRRAVSSVYYAVFHRLLRDAAGRFVGADQTETAAYAIIYRSFDHRQIRTVCEGLKAPALKVSPNMRRFAEAFLELQEARHRADYNPDARFFPTEVSTLIGRGEAAMEAFSNIESSEKTDILALMMVRGRD